MTVNKDHFTKLERKELRRLVGLAYERELAKALESLEGKFRQWNGEEMAFHAIYGVFIRADIMR